MVFALGVVSIASSDHLQGRFYDLIIQTGITTEDLTVNDDLTVTDALAVNGNATLGNASGDIITFSGPATAISSVTLNSTSMIKDTLTLASDSRGDITWNASAVVIDGNAAYALHLAANGQNPGIRIGTDGAVSISSGVYTTTAAIDGTWAFQIDKNDAGLSLANRATGSQLWKILRDGSSDDAIMQLNSDGAVTITLDTEGTTSLTGGAVVAGDPATTSTLTATGLLNTYGACIGVACTATAGAFEFYSRSQAQLNAITPTRTGQVYFCNDCSPLKAVISTGTSVAQFADMDGTAYN